MSPAQFEALAPLAVLGFGAVAAMLLAPKAPAGYARAAATLALGAAAALTAARLGAPEAPYAPLLADDGLARFGGLLAALLGLACLGFLRPPAPAKEGPALILLATLGAATLSAAVHAASLFLGLELVTLSLIALFVLPLARPAVEAGYKLLLLGGAGAAAVAFGLALAYAGTGTLALSGWGQGGALAALGAALLLAGLGFKFSLVPFHAWTPDAFAGVPAAAAAFAGAASKAAVGVALIRLHAAQPPEPLWSAGLSVLALASMLLGNIVALRQPTLARMLGWSSVAHSGYLAAMLASGSPLAPEGVLFHLAVYAPALAGALCAGAVLGPRATPAALRGLLWRRPLAGAALVISLVSLAGLPAAAGFVAKIYLFLTLTQTGSWALLAAAAAGSALGFYTYFRYVAAICRPGEAGRAPALAPSDGAVLAAASVPVLVLGLAPGPFIEVLRAALP